MKLHEYQSKALLEQYGVPVPKGDVATDPENVRRIAAELGGSVVVKAQVLMGGRGKAGGVKLFDDADSAAVFAQDLLGKRLVSIQNPAGMVVEKVLVTEKVAIAKEFYLAVLMDRSIQRLIVMLSAEGGMDIEQVAEEKPEAIVRLPVDPAWGLKDFELRKAVREANVPKAAWPQMIKMIRAIVKCYLENDADLVELNPCALLDDGRLIAADAKISIDDNALFRHKDYEATASDAAENPIEEEATKRGIAYVHLGGDIAIMGNGAGLVMQSLDEVNAAGGRPANFLDVGGGAQADRVKSCVELILMDSNVKGLLINIFGGITRVDEVAKGVLQAFSELDVRVPVVARIEGTAVEEGRKLLEGSQIIPAATVQEAAKKVVELAYA